jgi:hypothetical protein
MYVFKRQIVRSRSWRACYPSQNQGCQMVYFQTKNSNLGKFWRALQWKTLGYFLNIWSILRPFNIFYWHSVYFVVNLYIFPRVGILYQKIWQPCAELNWDYSYNLLFSLSSKKFWLRFNGSGQACTNTRVTRLGEFSPFGRSYSLVSFIKNTKVSQMFGLHFSTLKD